MTIDFIIVITYFAVVLIAALSGRRGLDISSEEYFLSNRNLRWYSISISTIATNVQGYQFLGMMGSAYLYGLAQANLEINAVQGLLMSAFIFVPLYLKDRVITITQFIKKRLGNTVGIFYSGANILLFSTVGLGAALFWGAYAADLVFGDFFEFIHPEPYVRMSVLIIILGVFSAIYTFYGGLSAVVRTDIIQFAILTLGGIIVTIVAVRELGGWHELYNIQPASHMKLHLPADHPKLPWIAIFGLFLLNINYWCANQSVVQRSLAARSLREAQIGLMVGGVMKYFMAVIIIIPGIALFGILGEGGLSDPDQTFPHLVKNFLPTGLRGIILCALFASMMSTIDSLFNSLATLWSVDIYKEYINKEATDRQMVQAGRRTILVTLVTGVSMGMVLLFFKLENPAAAFTHTLNELRYFINCGIVVLICAAAFLVAPKHRLAQIAFLATIPIQFLIIYELPDMNYFVRAMWVILIGFFTVGLFSKWKSWRELFSEPEKDVVRFGVALLISLIVLHVVFS
jgi:SSS family solute:Na+ symporter